MHIHMPVTCACRIVSLFQSFTSAGADLQEKEGRTSRKYKWLGSCLNASDDNKDEGWIEKDYWIGKKNTVTNQIESIFSLFLFLFRVNIYSRKYVHFISFRFHSLPFFLHLFQCVYDDRVCANIHIDISYVISC